MLGPSDRTLEKERRESVKYPRDLYENFIKNIPRQEYSREKIMLGQKHTLIRMWTQFLGKNEA
jgi:hypothetical protein